jgi:hypothetical protein
MLLKFELAKVSPALRRIGVLGFWLCCLPIALSAQSIDIASPSPITLNEVSGRIDPRDIGDARLTDHFYAFTGVPGDLLITVQGRNLNGDVDVFTTSGLRPLLKFSLYAETFTPVTKSIYLRKREDLIIRVEARTPNDDPGDYRLRFGGAFEPITSGPLLAAAEAAPVELAESETTSTARKGRRVSSVGARIEEPPEEVAAAPTPEPTPEPIPAESPATTPAETATATPAEEPKPTVTRTPRGRGVPGRRTRTRPPATVEQPAAAETETKPATDAEVAEAEPKPAPSRTATRRSGARPRVTDPPAEQEPEEASGPRLIIETNDGTLIDRYMSSVRRVTVENGRVLVVGKDGKIDRIPLANVVRMVIAP